MAGKPIEDDWQFTMTYVREESTWKVAAFHASTITLTPR
jgi:hypothetical protein